MNEALDAIAAELFTRLRAKCENGLPVAPRVLTLEKAAEYLSCTPKHVMSLVAAGWFSPVEWSSGKRPKPYFDVRALDAAIERAQQRKAVTL